MKKRYLVITLVVVFLLFLPFTFGSVWLECIDTYTGQNPKTVGATSNYCCKYALPPIWSGCCDSDGDGYGNPTCTGIPADKDCVDIDLDCSLIYGLGSDTYTYCINNKLDIHPGATEKCNGVDDDCDDTIDEGCDDDDDSYADSSMTCSGSFKDGNGVIRSCIDYGGDCNDVDSSINPGQTEICDGKDNDCSDPNHSDGVNPADIDENWETYSERASKLNSNQNGVCGGSLQQCSSGTWIDWYHSDNILNYEATEISCSDTLDNDCDTAQPSGGTDCVDSSCAGEIGPNAKVCCQSVSPDCNSVIEGNCGLKSCSASKECNVAETPSQCTGATQGQCGVATGSCSSVGYGYDCDMTGDNTKCPSCDYYCGGVPSYNCNLLPSDCDNIIYSVCNDPNLVPNDKDLCVCYGYYSPSSGCDIVYPETGSTTVGGGIC